MHAIRGKDRANNLVSVIPGLNGIRHTCLVIRDWLLTGNYCGVAVVAKIILGTCCRAAQAWSKHNCVVVL